MSSGVIRRACARHQTKTAQLDHLVEKTIVATFNVAHRAPARWGHVVRRVRPSQARIGALSQRTRRRRPRGVMSSIRRRGSWPLPRDVPPGQRSQIDQKNSSPSAWPLGSAGSRRAQSCKRCAGRMTETGVTRSTCFAAAWELQGRGNGTTRRHRRCDARPQPGKCKAPWKE